MAAYPPRATQRLDLTMTGHSADHDMLIQRWLLGDIAKDAPEVRELAEQCEECAERMRQMADVVERLDRSGALQREVLAEAELSEVVPGSVDVRRALEAEIGRATGPSWPLLFAAMTLFGIVSAIIVVHQWPDDAGPRIEIRMGAQFEVISPVDASMIEGPEIVFEWRDDQGTLGGHYALTTTIDGVTKTENSPVPRVTVPVGNDWESIEWSVKAYGMDGVVLGGCGGSIHR
ncbi:MAG: hypothetical protein KDC38_19770 [Planctomycetes bacterium]|nr:hypothetical protein [Planctomycetota bacterium]